MRHLSGLTALALTALACSSPPPEPPDPNPGNFLTAAAGWYRGDLHYHTTYSEDADKQGGDSLGTAVAIADAYRDPVFLAAHPEWEGDGLDFVAITDHRTDEHLSDPALDHPHLIVIPGEEYGGGGHANIFGLKKHIPHQPEEGTTEDAHHTAAIAEAHRQGAVFSINHPCQENPWPWHVDTIDSVEVWNAPWSAFWGEIDEALLDNEPSAREGTENPYIRAGVKHSGQGSNGQALWMWYAMLSRGLNKALVGGSDRHMLVPAGLPTTYVRRPDAFADRQGKALGQEGIIEGIRARGTFVSMSPHGAQILLEAVDGAGKVHPVGTNLPPGKYTVRWKVGRADKGLLRLVGGDVTAGEGPATPAPEVLHEAPLSGDLAEGSFEWTTGDGAWLHAVVLVPRIPHPLPNELMKAKEALDVLPTGKAIGAMLAVMAPIVDDALLFAPQECDPEGWEEWKAKCMPVDQESMATFYMPDAILRLMNTWFEDGQPTEWSLGALTSAFVAKE